MNGLLLQPVERALRQEPPAAERGGFSFPFPSGTGWPGLIEELEK